VVFGKKSDKNFWHASMKDDIWKTITARRNCGKAKNIIVFVGDGMGIPVITAARIHKGQKQGKPGEETFFNFERFPYTGLMRVRENKKCGKTNKPLSFILESWIGLFSGSNVLSGQ
jgi:alkaline phosphatase